MMEHYSPRSLRLIIGLLVTLVTFPAFAQSQFDGLYLSVGGGETETQAKVNAANLNHQTLTATNSALGTLLVNTDFNNTFSTLAQQQSLLGAFNIGYGYSTRKLPFYFALELFGNYANRQPNITSSYADNLLVISTNPAPNFNGITTTTIKLNPFEFGADFKPALLLTHNTLFYARIGAAFNKATITADDTVNVTQNFLAPGTNNTSTTETKNLTGLRLGFGLERFITQHFSLALDYIYTNYGSVNTTGTASFSRSGQEPFPPFPPFILTANTTSQNQKQVQLYSQSMLLSMHYYFTNNPDTSFENFYGDSYPYTATQHFGGFYLGLKAGYGGTAANTSTNIHTAIPLNGTVNMFASQSSNYWETSILGAAFVGYGSLINQSDFYLGAEIFGDASQHKMISDNLVQNKQTASFSSTLAVVSVNLATTTTVNLNVPEFGLDVRPGWIIGNNTLLYLRTGLAFNKTTITSATTQLVNSTSSSSPASTATSSLSTSENKTLAGLRLGVGLEQYLANNLALNIDYIYTNYGNLSVNGTANSNGFSSTNPNVPSTITNGLTGQASTKVSTQALMLGITWHFANPWG